jgi:hypothetical protein
MGKSATRQPARSEPVAFSVAGSQTPGKKSCTAATTVQLFYRHGGKKRQGDQAGRHFFCLGEAMVKVGGPQTPIVGKAVDGGVMDAGLDALVSQGGHEESQVRSRGGRTRGKRWQAAPSTA